MEYDVKILQGLAVLTDEWSRYKDVLFDFACMKGGERWARPDFRHHMYVEYIKPITPVTLRLFSLDDANVALLLRFVDEYLMDGIESRPVPFGESLSE